MAKGYGSFQSAWRTLQGIETVAMIRKGRVRWLAKGDAVGQARFIARAIRHHRIGPIHHTVCFYSATRATPKLRNRTAAAVTPLFAPDGTGQTLDGDYTTMWKSDPAASAFVPPWSAQVPAAISFGAV